MERAALILSATGAIAELDLRLEDADVTSKVLADAIGCQQLDVVRLTTRWDMWVDLDGRDRAPINHAAVHLAHRYGYSWRPYWGTVVFATTDQNGNPMGLAPDQLNALRRQLAVYAGGSPRS
ncbi:hypothetical protein ABZ801_00945 [Actinomadura sp. NPDC047616]|uniref:DUF3846 domain-containing protein n=1 Tax=Actinomadura sp. NPDC047616 TaxID=3155914 RepID=UPI0033F2EC80